MFKMLATEGKLVLAELPATKTTEAEQAPAPEAVAEATPEEAEPEAAEPEPAVKPKKKK